MNTGNTVPCATCGAPSDFFAKPVGPFCSNRCQLVDLGRWFAEDYRISEPLRPDHFEEFENWDGSENPPARGGADED
jgi:endogenous inhibitor of DNA gyrase (YacG/DUF329 family)